MTPAAAATASSLATLLVALGTAPAWAADPLLAPGRDPGGTAVAVITRGIDYTRPDLARVLARDGEGEAIAWDTVDGDRRPFAKDDRETDFALAAAREGAVRLVPVRTLPTDTASLAKAIAFAASTPARIVVVALEREAPGDKEVPGALPVVIAAAKRFEAVLFAISLPTPTPEEKSAAAVTPNLALFDSANHPDAAPDAVAVAFGCGGGEPANSTGADLERALLERLERTLPGCKPKAGGPQ